MPQQRLHLDRHQLQTPRPRHVMPRPAMRRRHRRHRVPQLVTRRRQRRVRRHVVRKPQLVHAETLRRIRDLRGRARTARSRGNHRRPPAPLWGDGPPAPDPGSARPARHRPRSAARRSARADLSSWRLPPAALCTPRPPHRQGRHGTYSTVTSVSTASPPRTPGAHTRNTAGSRCRQPMRYTPTGHRAPVTSPSASVTPRHPTVTARPRPGVSPRPSFPSRHAIWHSVTTGGMLGRG